MGDSRAERRVPIARVAGRAVSRPNGSKEPFLRAGRALRSLWVEGDSKAHTRLFETLIRDDYVIHGSSGLGGTYREHAVPLSLIRDHCLLLLGDGKSDDEVAAFIEEHLRIVLMTKQEAKHIDLELGFRTKMPPGWEVGDAPLARFKTAGISIVTRDVS
jgi:hypothetical protein